MVRSARKLTDRHGNADVRATACRAGQADWQLSKRPHFLNSLKS